MLYTNTLEPDPHFGIFYELMAFRVREILLVSSAYDAYIMEEDGSLAMRIINEYHGLNLSRPPRITWVSTVEQALKLVEKKNFDLVLTMPHLGSMSCLSFTDKVKELHPNLPVILMSHSAQDIMEEEIGGQIDGAYVWCCDSNVLLAIVKNVEDRRNVDYDTKKAMVRVILYVEDSPVHRSQTLPILYSEVVRQTQSVLDEGLNDQHRLLKMRARPKILSASTYEEALLLFHKYRSSIYAVISDVRFPKGGKISNDAGLHLMKKVRREVPDLPVLLLSTEPGNQQRADEVQAMFALKDPMTIRFNIHQFFLQYLGFGDFVFRTPDGSEIGRAANLLQFERMLHTIPDDSLMYHAKYNHFANWVMARAEIALASRLSKHHFVGINQPEHLREDLIFKVHALRKLRQKGVVAQFSRESFDPGVDDFVKIGQGFLGGKARGIAFVASQLYRSVSPDSLLSEYTVRVPQTCVITTQGFDNFTAQNNLKPDDTLGDAEIARRFVEANLPEWLEKDLRAFLAKIDCPLSVRSSSMLEDAQFRPYAGLYSTFMLTNSDHDFEVRFAQLARAVKLVYASTWFEGPRSFSRSISQQNQDSMAVLIQRLVGKKYGNYFYPSVSGTIQSYNFYPLPPMKSKDGIAYVALGFGKTVVEGERSLRFSPKYPENLPQLSSAEDMLKNTQRWFYCLDCGSPSSFHPENSNLVRRDIDEADGEYPVRFLSSTYFHEEQRVRDVDLPGPKVMTFASLLKHGLFPMAGIMSELITFGRKQMGCEVEMEFAFDVEENPHDTTFHFLQIRPIVTVSENRKVDIEDGDKAAAVFYSDQSLGHGLYSAMQDIIYIRPENFDASATREVAAEVGKMNRILTQENNKYLLVGFGRWGSADPWLGIPVVWHDISGAGAIIEIQGHGVTAEPSQGSHFFHNITSLGIPYLMVEETLAASKDGPRKVKKGLDWKWLEEMEIVSESKYVRHVRLQKPFVLKVNGHTAESVILPTG